MEKEQPTFGEAEARSIRDAGWRQGSIFTPPAELDIPVSIDRSRETLVVCSQSCAVVSPRIDRDPIVEFIIAKPIERYNPKCGEATGKNLRCFHLPSYGRNETSAFACDFNRRFQVKRQLLLEHKPDPRFAVSAEDARNLAGWIARNYTRIALPDALVNRAKGGIFKTIQTALRTNKSAGRELCESVKNIYISYAPESELLNGTYDVYLIFLCEDEQTEIELNSHLEDPLKLYTVEGGLDGIKLAYETKIPSQTFLSEIDGYKRLTEWDYLSNLGEIADSEY